MATQVNEIVLFHEGKAPDNMGRFWTDIIAQNDDWWESTHNFIQWIFPNRQFSFHNPAAPLLTDEVVAEFRSREDLKEVVRAVLKRFYIFLKIDEPNPWWVTNNNHNFLRITRVLHTLREFEMKKELNSFYNKLVTVNYNNQVITDIAFDYWTAAFEGSNDPENIKYL
jgi:hypothetical protein